MADEIFKAIKEVVGRFLVSSAKPLFAVTGEEDASGAVRAVIYSVALSGGNVAPAKDENSARKIISLTGGDGIFVVKTTDENLEVSFYSGNESCEILRKNLSGTNFVPLAGDIF